MDPRDRANAVLSRAQARRDYVVTPDHAISPMDAANTQQIPRAVVADLEHDQSADTTMEVSAGTIADLAQSTGTDDSTTPMPVQQENGAERMDGLIPTKKSRGRRSSIAGQLNGD